MYHTIDLLSSLRRMGQFKETAKDLYITAFKKGVKKIVGALENIGLFEFNSKIEKQISKFEKDCLQDLVSNQNPVDIQDREDQNKKIMNEIWDTSERALRNLQKLLQDINKLEPKKNDFKEASRFLKGDWNQFYEIFDSIQTYTIEEVEKSKKYEKPENVTKALKVVIKHLASKGEIPGVMQTIIAKLLRLAREKELTVGLVQKLKRTGELYFQEPSEFDDYKKALDELIKDVGELRK